MKETLQSLLRHALTALAGAGTFMAGRGLIAPEDAAAVDASGATIKDALVVVAIAVIMRLIITFTGKIFSGDSETASHSKDNGMSGLLMLLGMVGLMGLTLPSCSPAQMEAAKAFPIKACYTDEAGNKACYSSKGGIEVEVTGTK